MTEKEIVHYDIQRMAAEALAAQVAWVQNKDKEDLARMLGGLARRMRDITRADGALISAKETTGNLRVEELYVEGYFEDMPEVRFTTDFDAWENTIAIVGICPACGLETAGTRINGLESLGRELAKLKDGFVPTKVHQRKCTPDPDTAEPITLGPEDALLAMLKQWHAAQHEPGFIIE